MKATWRDGRNGFMLLGIACLLAGTACNKSADAAKKVRQTESQLNVPGMSPEEKKQADQDLEWALAGTLDTYEKIGVKDPKWDTHAREALKIFSQVQAYGNNLEGHPQVLQGYCGRARDLGCTDPMIQYIAVRFGDDSNLTPLEQANRYIAAAEAMEGSQYPPIRKFYAAARALQSMMEVRAPEWNNYGLYLERATVHLVTVLEDRQTPVRFADSACMEFVELINRWDDCESRFGRVLEPLRKNWGKEGFCYLAQGRFFVNYAWMGRSGKAASKVTEAQWKLFGERLALAEQVLQQGMTVAPRDGRLPTLMIKVVSGQNKGLEEMRAWFEKAMLADPNSYDAGDELMYFLLPRWFGSREDMIAFGRECMNNPKWGGTVPLMLANAHYTYNRYDGAKDGSYWLEPDVWPDVKLSYETFFKANPKAVSWRHNYARYALWCQQWDTFLEQLPLMGSEINYAYFGGEKEFDEAVKRAKENAAKKKE